MTPSPPSYVGETQIAHCGNGHYVEIGSDEYERGRVNPYEGHCPKCDERRTFTPVSGPVMLRP